MTVDALTERVLVFAPRGRDAELTCAMLAKQGLEAVPCVTGAALLEHLGEGAGCAIVTSDVLGPQLQRDLHAALAAQPPWSDFPVIVLTSGAGAGAGRDGAFDLGNMTILERPVAPETLLAAVRSALRARRRQYDARAAIDQRDQFLAMLGHELRNPLAAIALASETLPPERRTPAQFARRLAIVARQASHLDHLVNDLLDVARVATGRIQLRRDAVDIDAAIRDCLEGLEPRARDREIQIVVAAASGAIVEGDAGRIEQIIGNLATNAIKYSPVGRTVTISSAIVGDHCEIRVRDQGIGIAPDMLPRVFELFAQADRSLDRSDGGLGIGLALVDRLVRLHGGSVDVTSGGVGHGSEFIVRLPIGAPRLEAASDPAAAGRLARDLRIVVVDDNPDVLELTAMVFRELQCTVETAVDGEDGLARILAMRPDLALVDLGLPKLDGFALARRVREQLASPVLVAISGYGQLQDRERSRAAGFDRHLTKPVTAQALRALVDEVKLQLDNR